MTGNQPGQGRPRSDLIAAVYILCVQLFQLISLLFWGMIIPNTILVFAQGFSWDQLMFVLPVWSYPVLPLVCAYPAWGAYATHKIRRAVIIASVPLLVAIPFVALLYSGLQTQ
jgi:hypothetical protein